MSAGPDTSSSTARRAAFRPRAAAEQLFVAGLAAAVPIALAAHVGGYLPSAWGVIGIGAGIVILLGLALGRPPALTATTAIWVACFVLLGAWQLLSAAWTTGDGAAFADAQLTLVYAGVALALVVLVGRRQTDALVAGLGVGLLVVSLWGLGRHLLPDVLGGELARTESPRLAGPMGYTNAAGAVAGLGLLLGVAAMTHGGRWLRVVAGTAAVPLAATLYLTLSRGAILATAVGIGALFLLDRRRLDVAISAACVAVPVALAVWLAGRLPGTTGNASYALMRDDGHRLALQLLAVCALGGAVGLLRASLPSTAIRTRAAARRTAVIAALVVAAGLALVLVREGGPVRLVDRAIDSFSAAPAADANASSRLLSGSGTVRAAYWRVAWHMLEREPLLGEGAGSFERWWVQGRTTEEGVTNAHNLYLEMLGETGPIALLLVLAVFAIPVLALRRARDAPLAPAAVAGLAMIAAQSLLDWDWEIPLVMLPALALAAVPLAAGRPDGARRLPRAVVGVAAAGVVAIGLGIVVHVGNTAAVRAEDALLADDFRGAIRHAERARAWQPWSAEPFRLRGEAETALDRVPAAARELRRAVARNPESWEAWFDLALVTAGPERERAVRAARSLNPLGSEITLLGG